METFFTDSRHSPRRAVSIGCALHTPLQKKGVQTPLRSPQRRTGRRGMTPPSAVQRLRPGTAAAQKNRIRQALRASCSEPHRYFQQSLRFFRFTTKGEHHETHHRSNRRLDLFAHSLRALWRDRQQWMPSRHKDRRLSLPLIQSTKNG